MMDHSEVFYPLFYIYIYFKLGSWLKSQKEELWKVMDNSKILSD